MKHEQTVDQCEELNYCSITNENEVFARNAIHFSKPANNLSIEGTIGGQKFSFLIDTGANVSAIRADVWRQLPPPTNTQGVGMILVYT